MKALHRTGLALAIGTLSALSAHANLLTNAGAETGTLAGWTPGGDATAHVDNGSFDPGINPNSGSYDFVGWTSDYDTLTQSVALASSAAGQTANVSFFEQGLNQGTPSDDAYVSLVFFDDVDDIELGTVKTSTIDSHAGAWTGYSGSFAVPFGTTSIRYTMNFVRNAGSDLDAFIDDNSLTVSPAAVTSVPEPTNAVLLLAGLALVGRFAARRRAGR